MGGSMRSTIRLVLLSTGFAGILFSGATARANPSTLKCNANKDLVWLYDSLASFDIQAKLTCGETVEIIGRVKDFVRIRTRSGVVGYVPDTEISDVPAFQDPTPDVSTVAKQVQAKEIAKAAEAQAAFQSTVSELQESAVHNPDAGPSLNLASPKDKKANGQIPALHELGEMSPSLASAPAVNGASDTGTETPAPGTIAPSSDVPAASAGAMPDIATPPAEANANTDLVPSSAATGSNDQGMDLPTEIPNTYSACQNYFSAYGLTSSQLKWITQNREKMFPSVCPAPDPSRVNFVFIFTHDVDFYNGTMPEPVHKANGFSDFQPLTMVDSTLVPESGDIKAHREYVWVFQFDRGSFNPGAFSPHRRYQFTKAETNSLGSRAAPRVVEDAFRFVEGSNR